jgi:hypothetical protein
VGRDVSGITAGRPAALRLLDDTKLRLLAGNQDSGRCFAIRSYQFEADSDVVKRLGSSTCQRSNKVKMKNLGMPPAR